MAETVALRQVVLDCPDARRLAEFYRELLGFVYRPGDEPRARATATVEIDAAAPLSRVVERWPCGAMDLHHWWRFRDGKVYLYRWTEERH